MATPQGTKRQAERSMEKCSVCRLKRIKCLPTSRDWSKGERCAACVAKDEPCGANIRAPKTSRNATPNITSNKRALAPASPPKLLLPPPAAPPFSDPSAQTAPVPQSGSSASEVPLSPSDADAGRALPSDSWKPLALTSPPVIDTAPYDASFIHLGHLRNFLENVQSRLQSISSDVPRSSRSTSDPAIENALEVTAYGTQSKFGSEITNILGLVNGLEPSRKELVLRRALDAIDDFLDILAGTAPSRALVCHHSILESKATILSILITIYEEKEDFPEVERLSRKVSALPDVVKWSLESEICSHFAHSVGRTSSEMQKVLVELEIPEQHKKSLYLTGTDPFPPIHRALLYRDPLLTRHLFETNKQSLEQMDVLRRQPVHIAAETSNSDLLDFLSPEDRKTLQTPDICRRTPLCIAAYKGNLSFFKKLAKAGAEKDSKDENGRSILSVACGAGHLPIVRFLLDENVSPNDDLLQGGSPLRAAASAGHEEICRALLDHGAWIDWPAKDKTASQLARENNHFRIIDLIAQFERRPENCCPYPYNPWSMCTEDLMEPISDFSAVPPPSTPVRPYTGLGSPPTTGRTITADGSHLRAETETGSSEGSL